MSSDFYTVIKKIFNKIDFNGKIWVSFIKTFLLIIVTRVVINDWNVMNSGMLMEKSKKYYFFAK